MNNKMTLTPEEAYAVEQTLAEGAALPPGLKAKQIELNADRAAFKAWVDEHKNTAETKSDGSWAGNYKFTAEDYHKRSNDLAAKTAEFHASCEPVVALHRLDQIAQIKHIKNGAAMRNGVKNAWEFGASGSDIAPTEIKSIYDVIGENAAFKAMVDSIPLSGDHGFNRRVTISGVDMAGLMAQNKATKTLFSTSAGFPSPTNRSPLVVPFAHRRPVVANFIPSMPYDLQIYPYLEQTAWTNNAAAVAEGAVKPESALAYVQRTARLEVIGTTLPITKQVQWFAPQILQDTMQRDLVDMLGIAEELEILNGTGTSPDLQGISTRSGIQTYAKAAAPENNMDAILQAQQLIRFTGFAEPDVTFINPANMTSIMLSKDSQNRYLYGDPHNAAPMSIWGLPIVQTAAATVGTAITGDFGGYAMLLRKGDVMVTLGYVNNQFISNELTMLVEELVGLVVKRPAAFATVTALS